MNLALGIAALICFLLAIGHTAIGVVWVLPGIKDERMPRTPFGPESMTAGMIRVSWFIVTIFVSALGGLLMTLALDEAADARTLLLRWFAAMWVVATVMALWVARKGLREPRTLLRLPVPLLWMVVAALCWTAST